MAAMKVRDSGMPERDYWESLFDVPGVLDALAIGQELGEVVELGCGYGTFTVPVAHRIGGTLHAFDIDPAMIAETRARLEQAGVGNVRLHERDVFAGGFGLPPASADAVLLFNILHAETPVDLLRLSADVLRPGGVVAVIHWRSDVPTPRGPALSIRPRPEHVTDWAAATGLLVPVTGPLTLPPWHFGMVLGRTR